MTLLFSVLLLFAQPDTLTLEACYREALANWPTLVQSELKQSIADLKSDNLDSRYLPSLSMSGQAVYHSSVVTFPFETPGVTTTGIPNDQYAASLDLNQLVYDGGEISSRKRLSQIEANVAALETDVELHQVRERVNGLFFDVLLLQSQIQLTRTFVSDLEARLSTVEVGVENGVALPSDADVIEAELIKVRQELDATDIRRRGRLAALAQLMGRSIDASAALEAPNLVGRLPDSLARRPELDLFEERSRQLEEMEDLTSASVRPRISGFGQAGYGRPPDLNFFTSDFEPYYVLGLRLKWQFWDWSQSSRERQIRQIEQQVLTSEEEAFTRNISIESEIQLAEIVRLDSAISSDERVIALRRRISADASAKLDNGVITATDYLIERNQEYRAELQKAVHEIQRSAARVRYATTIGAYL